MRHYFALIHKDDDSAYGIQFPDLKGVHSAADDAAHIVRNAIEALRLIAEDGDLPEPSRHAAILQREDIRKELSNGAYLVSVPLIENDTAVLRVNVTFQRGLLRAIDAAAETRGQTRSAFLANAARREIEV